MSTSRATERPLVSVILAVYNEAEYIESCLSSIVSQEAEEFELEILAIDGNSTDGTRQILERIAARDPRIRVLNNSKRKAPFAFNLGLSHARGQYVCIFGSHSAYQKNYISTCLRELQNHAAVACGGRVITRPRNDTMQARLVAWTLSHPFGSSRKSFRTQAEGAVDTVNYPVASRDALLEVGGYDEDLIRNQDNDVNQKLRARGHKLVCTWKTSCFYYPNGSLRELLAYASRNGFWNVTSLVKNPASMALRHFVPFLFLAAIVSSSLLAAACAFAPWPYRMIGAAPLAILLGVHLAAGVLASLQIAWREKSLEPFCLPLVFLMFHCAYGFGTLTGFTSKYRRIAALPKRLIATKA